MAIGCLTTDTVFPASNTYEAAFIDARVMPPAPNNIRATDNLYSTAISFGNPNYATNTTCAKKNTSFYDLFYERIWITPTSINFSGIDHDTPIAISVWNSYSSSKTLSSVDISTSGITQTLANNTVFAPFENKTTNISYATSAPIILTGTALFNFLDAEDVVVQIFGSKTEILLLNHQWETEVTERYSYLTDLIESDNGTEQVIRLKPYPSRTINYQFLAINSSNYSEVSQYRAYFDNFLSYNQDKLIVIPILTDKLLTQSTIPIGTSTITFDKNPQYYDFYQNGFALIYNSYQNYEVLQIDSISSNSITFKTNTTKLWKLGTVVAPLRQAYLEKETLSVTESTGIVNEYTDFSFIISPTETLINPRFTTYTADYMYKGYPIYFSDHNYETDKSIEVYKNFNQVGEEYGIISRTSRLSANRKKFNLSILKGDRVELSKLLGFFDYLKGKFNYFWLPQKNNTFQLSSNYTAGQAFIKVKNIGYSRYIGQNQSRRNIIFRHKDGSYIFNKIINSMDTNDGTETLYLETPMASNYLTTDFTDISYLYFCRSDADALEISYQTQELFNVNHSFVQLLTSPE